MKKIIYTLFAVAAFGLVFETYANAQGRGRTPDSNGPKYENGQKGPKSGGVGNYNYQNKGSKYKGQNQGHGNGHNNGHGKSHYRANAHHQPQYGNRGHGNHYRGPSYGSGQGRHHVHHRPRATQRIWVRGYYEWSACGTFQIWAPGFYKVVYL
ncbi:MAG: hypothetical protein ACJAZ3_001480 [Sphingobacteriales bacterium]|jgi:hypothetical protein